MKILSNDIDLLEFFESESEEISSEDNSILYRYEDLNGLRIDFSYNEIQCSVQVGLFFADNVIANFSQEGATKLEIKEDFSGKYIACLFEFKGAIAKVKVKVKPFINVNWYTLTN